MVSGSALDALQHRSLTLNRFYFFCWQESVVSGSALGALQSATRLRCLSFDRLVAVDSDEVIVGFMGDSADDTAWAPLSRLGSVERLHVGLHECEWPLADALAAVSGLTGLQVGSRKRHGPKAGPGCKRRSLKPTRFKLR